MDYEKKYKEALERMKRWAEGTLMPPDESPDTLCTIIFPELTESEDERTRKVIRQLMLGMREEIFTSQDEIVTKEKVLAWLEKQKESLHIQESCKENAIFFTDAYKDTIIAIEKYLDWLTGYPDYAPKGKYSLRDMLYCLSLLEKQKEQKPVEPPDDELERHQMELYDFKVFATKQAKEHHISFVHDFEWNNFCAELLSYFADQQNSLWSNDDKETMQDLIELLWIIQGSSNMKPGTASKYTQWLKSLRPSWKPSEEQMKALQCAIVFMEIRKASDYDITPLKSLYEDLKKL